MVTIQKYVVKKTFQLSTRRLCDLLQKGITLILFPGLCFVLLGPDFSVCDKGKTSSGLSGGRISQNMDSLYVRRCLSAYLVRSNRIVPKVLATWRKSNRCWQINEVFFLMAG